MLMIIKIIIIIKKILIVASSNSNKYGIYKKQIEKRILYFILTFIKENRNKSYSIYY